MVSQICPYCGGRMRTDGAVNCDLSLAVPCSPGRGPDWLFAFACIAIFAMVLCAYTK